MFAWLSRSVAAVATTAVPISADRDEGGAAVTATGEQIAFEPIGGWATAR
jgi:hypothetical protein